MFFQQTVLEELRGIYKDRMISLQLTDLFESPPHRYLQVLLVQSLKNNLKLTK